MWIANRFGISTGPRRLGRVRLGRRVRTIVGAGGAALGVWAAALGCLPDPVVHVPDFGPSPSPIDMATPPQRDGAVTPDLGAATWGPDGNSGTTQALRGAWVADPALSVAYAVGNGGTIVRRSGGTWQTEVAKDADMVITDTLYAVAALAPDQVYAVGDQGVILRRVSDKWTREGKELRLTSALYGVTVLANGEVIAVGDGGVIARRKAAGVWSLEPVDMALSRASFRAVFGSSDTDLIAVGMGAVITQPSGGTWTPDAATLDPADRGNFYAVAATQEGPFVAGDYGRILRRAAGKWSREAIAEPMPRPASPVFFYGLTTTQGDLFAVGSGGIIERRDAATKAWVIEPSGLPQTQSLYAVAGARTGDSARSLLAIGAEGAVRRRM